jgi:hypothetical protein
MHRGGRQRWVRARDVRKQLWGGHDGHDFDAMCGTGIAPTSRLHRPGIDPRIAAASPTVTPPNALIEDNRFAGENLKVETLTKN